jgi:hypothetical protein
VHRCGIVVDSDVSHRCVQQRELFLFEQILALIYRGAALAIANLRATLRTVAHSLACWYIPRRHRLRNGISVVWPLIVLAILLICRWIRERVSYHYHVAVVVVEVFFVDPRIREGASALKHHHVRRLVPFRAAVSFLMASRIQRLPLSEFVRNT